MGVKYITDNSVNCARTCAVIFMLVGYAENKEQRQLDLKRTLAIFWTDLR